MANQDSQADQGQRDAPPHQTNGPSRRRLLYLLGAGGAAGLAGCSGLNDGGDGTDTATETTGTGTTTATGTGTPEKELHESVTIGVGLNFVRSTFIPKYNFILGEYRAALEPLVRTSRNFKAKPWLAKDWERTSEKTWEFTLRENVTFHNGDSLTADIVISAFEQRISEFSWYSGYVLNVEEEGGIKKIDDMTIEMTTQTPTGNQPANLSIVIHHPETSMRKEGNEPADVAGTGPYEIEEIKIDKYAKFSPYDDYWGGDPPSSGPHMEELIYRPFDDRNTRALALAGQKIDAAHGLPAGQFNAVKNAKNTKVASRTGGNFAQMRFNLYNKPMSDLKFRKAVNYAISQEKIVEGPQNGLAVPGRGPVSPAIWLSAYDSLPTYGPDKDKAKQLVEQSSYNDEKLQYIGREGEPRESKLVASTIQQELKDIGVNLEIQIIGKSLFNDRRGKGDFDMWAGTNSIAGTRIVENLFAGFASDDLPRAGKEGPGWSKYHTNIGHNQPEVQKRYDSLYTKALESPSDEKTKELTKKLEHVLMEDALPFVPLFHSKKYMGMRPGIEGVDWHPKFDKSRIENLKYFK